MSETELRRLMDDLGQQEALARNVLGAASLDEAAERARAAGYDVTAQDATRLAAAGELSDKDLEIVTGGKDPGFTFIDA